jgi:hypothetical protein
LSHSKGLWGTGTCNGTWKNYGRPHDGMQQQRCTRCGRVRNKRVRSCWFNHDWRKSGRAKNGEQNLVCRRCGARRTEQAKPCSRESQHRWTSRGVPEGMLRCKRCGAERASDSQPRNRPGNDKPMTDSLPQDDDSSSYPDHDEPGSGW